jgi:hypothetical protein
MKIQVISALKVACLLAALGLGLASVAHAQWGWTDKDGRRIFSDQGPASEVPDKNIFKRPNIARAATPVVKAELEPNGSNTEVGAASAPKPGASTLKIASKDPELEKKKKETDDAAAAKRKAEETKFAAQQAENCERAKKAKASYASGVRIATTNAKGEREIMSDTDRASESKRLEGVIAVDCK